MSTHKWGSRNEGMGAHCLRQGGHLDLPGASDKPLVTALRPGHRLLPPPTPSPQTQIPSKNRRNARPLNDDPLNWLQLR